MKNNETCELGNADSFVFRYLLKINLFHFARIQLTTHQLNEISPFRARGNFGKYPNKMQFTYPLQSFSKLFKMTADDGIIPPTVQKNAVGSMLRMLVNIFSSVAQEFISRRPVTTLPGQSFSKVYDSA